MILNIEAHKLILWPTVVILSRFYIFVKILRNGPQGISGFVITDLLFCVGISITRVQPAVAKGKAIALEGTRQSIYLQFAP